MFKGILIGLALAAVLAFTVAAATSIYIGQIKPAATPGANGAVAYTSSTGVVSWLTLTNPINQSAPTVPSFTDGEVPTGTVNGTNAVFTLTTAPNPAVSLLLQRNGLVLVQGASGDYTLSGNTVTFNTEATPSTGDSLQASYRN